MAAGPVGTETSFPEIPLSYACLKLFGHCLPSLAFCSHSSVHTQTYHMSDVLILLFNIALKCVCLGLILKEIMNT